MDDETRMRLQIGRVGVSHDFINPLLCGVVSMDLLDDPEDFPIRGEQGLREQLAQRGAKLPFYDEYVKHALVPSYESRRVHHQDQPFASPEEVLSLVAAERIGRLNFLTEHLRRILDVRPSDINLVEVKLLMGLIAIVIRGPEHVSRLKSDFHLTEWSCGLLLRMAGEQADDCADDQETVYVHQEAQSLCA